MDVLLGGQHLLRRLKANIFRWVVLHH
jgi:hypothetical protein